jgi:hypothetical protein
MARIETQAKAGNVAALASEVETAGGVFRESIALVKRERGI